MAQTRQDAHQFVIQTVARDWEPLVQVFEGWVNTAAEQALECLLVQRQLEQILPGERPVLVRQLPVLLEQPS